MTIGIRDLKNMVSDSEIEMVQAEAHLGGGRGGKGEISLLGAQCPPKVPFVQFLRSHVDTTAVKTLMKKRLRKPV